MSNQFTLPPVDPDLRDHSRDVFVGAPTWARRSVGANQYERIRLEDRGNLWNKYELVGRRWVVPAAAWNPRDHVETGPVPPGVRIDFEVEDQYSTLAAFAPEVVGW